MNYKLGVGSWGLGVRRICALSFIICLLFSAIGCEAFVRKFTRKSKKENLPREELVLVPEEYKGPQMGKEELYRQYLLFWKSWAEELVQSLEEKNSLKKHLDCLQESEKNLQSMKALLSEAKQKELESYVAQLKELEAVIAKDLYNNNALNNSQKAERIKRNILRDFSYNKIKDSLL